MMNLRLTLLFLTISNFATSASFDYANIAAGESYKTTVSGQFCIPTDDNLVGPDEFRRNLRLPQNSGEVNQFKEFVAEILGQVDANPNFRKDFELFRGASMQGQIDDHHKPSKIIGCLYLASFCFEKHVWPKMDELQKFLKKYDPRETLKSIMKEIFDQRLSELPEDRRPFSDRDSVPVSSTASSYSPY